MNKIYTSIVRLLPICLSIIHTNAVTHVYLDTNTTYRAWTAPGASGRCIKQGIQSSEWQYQDIAGTELINELLPDPCAYQITCPQVATYDANKVLCSIEADWNRNLSTCALARNAPATQNIPAITPVLCKN